MTNVHVAFGSGFTLNNMDIYFAGRSVSATSVQGMGFNIPDLYDDDGRAYLTNFQYDIAVVKLSQPIGYRIGWFENLTSSSAYHLSRLNVAGSTADPYPRFDGDTLIHDYVSASYDRELSLIHFSSGNINAGASGSPIFAEVSGEPYVVGVYAFGSGTADGGPRITDWMLGQINSMKATLSDGPTEGNDVIEGSSYNDLYLYGYGGNDQIAGFGGDDMIFGHAGNDQLDGGPGNDRMDAGSGADVVVATTSDGDDFVTGGNGWDVLNYSMVGGVVQVNQLAGITTGSAGNDTLMDVFEQIIGTNFADVLAGGHGINVLDGNGGDDKLFGNQGSDLMRGGPGDDTFYSSVSDGDDRLRGDAGFDVLDYSTMAWRIQVNQLAGTTTGSAGNDTLLDDFEYIRGSQAGDVLAGGHGVNALDGGGGDDLIFANNGNDWVRGGTGSDTITLGFGNDTFQFFDGDGHDTVTDFLAGAGSDDVVNLRTESSASSFAQMQINGMITQVGANTVIDFGGGDMITLLGVNAASLHSDDFIF